MVYLKYIIIIVILFIFISSRSIRVLISHLHFLPYYSIKDIFKYIINGDFKKWNGFGIRMYCGYFGSGKSMLACKFITESYNKYNINIISNIPLSIPYVPLVNKDQIVNCPDNSIIFIDECNTLFNARSWKDFPTEIIYQLCQNRKKRIMLIMTAPRFHLVDKSIRDVTQFVYECNKSFWRIHLVDIYDGWQRENAIDINLLKPLSSFGVFARDKYYKNYDSFAIIDNVKKEEFLSNREIIENRSVNGNNIVINNKIDLNNIRKNRGLEKRGAK